MIGPCRVIASAFMGRAKFHESVEGGADRPGWLPDNTQGKPTAPGRVLLDDLRKPKSQEAESTKPGSGDGLRPDVRAPLHRLFIVHTNIDQLATNPIMRSSAQTTTGASIIVQYRANAAKLDHNTIPGRSPEPDSLSVSSLPSPRS